MNARASNPLGVSTDTAGRAEHISIEADTDYLTPARPAHRKVRAKYVLHSSVRKCSTELALLDDHYLQVHAKRARKDPLKYVVDLRFLNSQPVRIRRIAWTWFLLSAALMLGAAGGGWLAYSTGSMFSSPYSVGAVIAAIGAFATMLVGVRGTSESLNFSTINGAVTVVRVLGGLGSTKAGKEFFVAMIKDIAAAKAARPQQKPQWLRDEMREHHRLRELGVLSDAEYEASKTRILQAHS